jgi:hypothetical protein
MATVSSICTEINKTTDMEKLDWVAWEPGSQNPPTSHSASFGEGCSVSLLESGEIVIYAPDGEKGRTTEGFATMKAKAVAYCTAKAAEEEEEATTKSLDEIEAALKALQVSEAKGVEFTKK